MIKVDPSRDLMVPVLKKIVRCLGESDSRLVESAIKFIENDNFLFKLEFHRDLAYPILVPVIEDLSMNHWDEDLKEDFEDLKSTLKTIDDEAYEDILKAIKEGKIGSILKPDQNLRVKFCF